MIVYVGNVGYRIAKLTAETSKKEGEMTTKYEEAAKRFGAVCYSHEDYEVRAITKDDGLHVFVFRRVKGIVQLPHGFFMGHNHLFFPKREIR